MDSFAIVQLAPDEWEAYRVIRLEALQTEPQAFGSSYATSSEVPESAWRSRLEEAERGETSWLLFARAADGDLIGILGAYASEDSGVVDVISMYVSPRHRGQGVARALMTAVLEALAATRKFDTARLAVNVEQEAAKHLYRSFGFQTVRTESDLLGDGQRHDEDIMEKSLR